MLYSSGKTINELFLEAVSTIGDCGRLVAPRNIETLEVFPAVFELVNPRARVLTVEGRQINPAFAVAEALWILSGSDSNWIFTYNSQLAQYANEGKLRGAYGPRLRSWAGCIDQLETVRRTLIEDPYSRRAVVQIYDPHSVKEDDLDVPCTIGYRFLIRNGELHLFATMRSQDLWLGFPYDVFSNTVIQELMAGWIGVSLGHYYHYVDSLHLYKKDLECAALVKPPLVACEGAMHPITMEWETLPKIIESILTGTIEDNPSLASMAGVLASYRDWKAGNQPRAIAQCAAVGGTLGVALKRWYQNLMTRKSASNSTC